MNFPALASEPLFPPSIDLRPSSRNLDSLSASTGERDKGEVSISPATVSILPLFTAWIPKINRAYGEGIAATFHFAHVVAQARRSLEKGDWTKLCNSGEVPFRIRQGQMLLSIHKRFHDLDAQTSARLPWAWTTLYHLSRLPRATLLTLIDEQVITPLLSEKAAQDLLRKSGGRRSPGGPNLRRRIKSLRDLIQKNLNHWTPEQRAELATALHSLSALLGQVLV